MSDAFIETVARAIWKRKGGVHERYFSPFVQCRYLDTARAAISAIEAAGYRIVPLVATPEMLEAAWDKKPANHVSFLLGYEAMLAAAPKVLP